MTIEIIKIAGRGKIIKKNNPLVDMGIN